MKKIVTDSGVTIIKRVNATEEATIFNYEIDTHGSTAGHLQLTEQLSEPVEFAEITLSEHSCGSWDVHGDDRIAFTADFSQSESVEPTARIASTSVEPQRCISNVTVSTAVSTEGYSATTTNGNRSDNSVTEMASYFDSKDDFQTNGNKTITRENSKATAAAPVEQHHPSGNVSMPVVGLIATDENIGAVARTIVRAAEYGLAVVTVVEKDSTTAASIVKQLDAVAIQSEVSRLDIEHLKSHLTDIIRDTSYTGVIFQQDCSKPISFEQSVRTFEAAEKTVVEAVSRSKEAGVLVGIPAFNEAETVGTVVAEASNYADEVVVVDDGSSDDTAAVSRQAGATVLSHDHNRGYGRGLKTLFRYAADRDVESLVILDADGQHDPRDIPQLVAAHETSGAEIVIGNRFGETAATEMPLYRRCGLWVITQLLNLTLGNIRPSTQIQDAQSGFRSYNSSAIRSIAEQTNVIDDQMSASTDILFHAHANDFRIEEIPTTISYDVTNANSRNPITHGISIVNNIRKKLERNYPLTVVGIPGVLLMSLGIGLGYSTLSTYAASGELAVESTVGSLVFVLIGAFVLITSLVRYVLNTSFDGHNIRQI